MEKNNELAKEERTIFIVLAIIILIAIGVLVTWYFTKDKDLEDKDTTTNKTVDTIEEKEKEDTSTPTVVAEEPKSVVVFSSNVKEEEVAVVDVSQTVTEEIGNVEPSETIYNPNLELYLVGENINFANFVLSDEVTITNGVITKVELVSIEGNTEATGKYSISNSNVITFNEAGIYAVTVLNSDGTSYEVTITVITEEELVESSINFVNGSVMVLEEAGKEYYDSLKYDEYMKATLDYLNMDTSDKLALRDAYSDLLNKYLELESTFDQEKYQLDKATKLSELTELIKQIQEKIEAGTYESNDIITTLIEKANGIIESEGKEVSINDIEKLIAEITEAEKNLEPVDVEEEPIPNGEIIVEEKKEEEQVTETNGDVQEEITEQPLEEVEITEIEIIEEV